MGTVFSRRGLSGQLAGDLGRRIVDGTLAPGTTIDVEALEVEASVSRTVVRESLKVLTDKGLLDARPRIGTYVLPRASWNLLDSDVMTWRAEGGMSDRLLGELDQLRHMIEPWAAAAAAERRTEDDLADLRDALDAMSGAFAAHRASRVSQLEAHIEADIAFHSAILTATHNELVSHMDHMLRPILAFRDALIPESDQNEAFLDAHLAVLRAIEESDGAGAQRAMTALLDAAAADVDRLAVVPGAALPTDPSST